MVLLFLATLLPFPPFLSLSSSSPSLARIRFKSSFCTSLFRSASRFRSPPLQFKSPIHLPRLRSNYAADGNIGAQVPSDGSELIFLGTGTSEGIPRSSCLTNPLKKCLVKKKTHYYLVDTSIIIPGAAVSKLQFNIIKEEPFTVHNLKIIPLPVWHGHGNRSLGFRFGNICYISDVSDIPKETYALLEDCEILLLDALRPDRSSATHFGLPRALAEVQKIQPKRTLFTGMMHLMDHDVVNADLAQLKETEDLDVQLSYDGLRIPINL